MKNLALIGFSVVTMLVSCKCKKAVADAAPAEAVNMEVKPGETMPDNLVPVEKAAKPEEMKTIQESEVVEYEANTRGYFFKVRYAGGKIGFTRERDSDKMQMMELTKAQVEELNTLLGTVELTKLPDMKAPTEKRLYDGAAMANLKITKGGNEYNSQTFDHGAPPVPIDKFVKKLLSYVKEK